MSTLRTFRYVRVGAAAAAVLLATGCQGLEGRACTLIGAESGVTVTWRPADFPAGAHYRFCVDGTCQERGDVPASDPMAFLSLDMPEVTGERQVTVRLLVTDPAASGRTVYDRTAPFTLRRHAPNGEGCDPVVWQAGVRADPQRGLVSPV